MVSLRAMTSILKTQAETDTYLAEHVAIGQCIPATFAPTEEIDLTRWIGPSECCDECGEATPGLRRDKKGRPREDCAACGGSGMLITCWGEAQTERWQEGRRYDVRGKDGEIEDDGPQVGPIRVCGGVTKFARSLERQAHRAFVKFERAAS